MTSHPYHHGDLRRSLIDEAIQAISDEGPTGWSMRELARRIGVSHAASSRHFADKRDLLTAVAGEGWVALADALETAERPRQALYDVGRAYMRFAIDHTAHFELVTRPELYDAEDDAVVAARDRVLAVLYRSSAQLGEADPVAAGVSAWALVHGLASLHLQGMLPPAMGDPLSAFRTASGYMFTR